MIHPTAVIHPKATLDSSVSVGPYAVIDEGVQLGADCILGPHVYITGKTRIGRGNRFYAGAVIGEAPQDLKYDGTPTGLQIGDGNVFREHVTVHRSSKPEEDTIIGSGNFLMANAHVAHNCHVGNHAILANGCLLGGHVTIQDRAFVSGNCLVHQFVRVGTLAMMQGGSAISKDLPPYTIARGDNGICGLNIVGMRRAGLGPAERLELRQLYRFLFREGRNVRAAVAEAAARFNSPSARVMIEFLQGTRRGVCVDTSSGADDTAEGE